MTSAIFSIPPISADAAAALRVRGGPVYIADSMPGYPCRQCLTDASIGDELILVSHDPFQGTSPYRSSSPIFLHREPCGPSASDDLPLQLTRRRLSVRSFDNDEMMIDAHVVQGSELDVTLRDLFSNDAAERVHIHNADRGCWAATAVRSDAPTGLSCI